MTIDIVQAERERFLFLLEIVRREANLLIKTDARLFNTNIDANWVLRLENEEDLSERLDAFVSRFGRMQDNIGDKLIPSILRLLAEKPSSALDNLNKMEKLGLISSATEWLDIRNLRNRLVHEYVVNAEEFARTLNQAHRAVTLLITTYDDIHLFASSRMSVPMPPL